ncbi:hypothetical protein HPP92_000552 [Vanilla planifolia]|uniref:Uncharacterized protein n=1 Tax=Vanilla planifolia TaxID=51239 RepID=A0A835RXP2_VANPL|nr:hypothetical protein HPP92_000552 [Vanilla planifolia]
MAKSATPLLLFLLLTIFLLHLHEAQASRAAALLHKNGQWAVEFDDNSKRTVPEGPNPLHNQYPPSPSSTLGYGVGRRVVPSGPNPATDDVPPPPPPPPFAQLIN